MDGRIGRGGSEYIRASQISDINTNITHERSVAPHNRDFLGFGDMAGNDTLEALSYCTSHPLCVCKSGTKKSTPNFKVAPKNDAK